MRKTLRDESTDVAFALKLPIFRPLCRREVKSGTAKFGMKRFRWRSNPQSVLHFLGRRQARVNAAGAEVPSRALVQS